MTSEMEEKIVEAAVLGLLVVGSILTVKCFIAYVVITSVSGL